MMVRADMRHKMSRGNAQQQHGIMRTDKVWIEISKPILTGMTESCAKTVDVPEYHAQWKSVTHYHHTVNREMAIKRNGGPQTAFLANSGNCLAVSDIIRRGSVHAVVGRRPRGFCLRHGLRDAIPFSPGRPVVS
jgi:hypothetical protein